MNTRPHFVSELQFVVFQLDAQRYALELARVERVLPMVAIAAFPRAPAIVAGLIDLQGELVPAIDLRKRFGLPARAPRPSDQLLIARSARRRLALAVDAVGSVLTLPANDLAAPDTLVPGLEYVRGIVQLPAEGIVFVHDLDACLSLDEERALATALSAPLAS